MRIAGTIVAGLMLAWSAAAADTASWQNLGGLQAGQKVDVRANSGDVSGEFVRFDAAGLTVRNKKGEHSVAQADVTRVSLAKRSRGIWIGVAAGGGGGLAAGAALGSRLANESGGDFNNLKPVIAAGCGAVGALIGATVGAAVRRTTVIYQR